MKVLHVVESLSPKWGGLSRAVAGLSEAMVRHGLEVEIITTIRGNEEQFYPKGAKAQAFRRGPLSWWGYAHNLRSAIERAVLRADIIHTHGLWLYPNLIASRAAWHVGKPYVISPHGMLDPWALGHKKYKKRIYASLIEWRTLSRANAIHALSRNEAIDVKSLHFMTPVAVIPNGLDLCEFAKLPDRSTLTTNRYPVLTGKMAALFLGRIHPKKGLDLLARAFCEIMRKRDDVILVIAGPDETGNRDRIESHLKAEGGKDHYIFTGMLRGEERLMAFAAADIFILPSYSEGLPMAVIEAMAAGLPVVISDRVNIHHDVHAYKAGIVTKCDVQEIANAVETLLDNEAIRKEMGENGKRLVQDTFTWDVIVPKIIKLYEQVLAGKVIESGA
jgi:glycosyltransferase involved in cell wall biosynthesis